MGRATNRAIAAAFFLMSVAAPALAFQRADRPYPAPDIGAFDETTNALAFVDGGVFQDQPAFAASVACNFPVGDSVIQVVGQMIGPDAQISTPTKLKFKQKASLLMSVIHFGNTLFFRVDDVIVPFCGGALSLSDKDGNLSFYDETDRAVFGLTCKGDLAAAMGLTEEQNAVFQGATGGTVSCKGKVLGDISNGCFRGDTVVSTESGARPIREIAVGDRVWSWDEAAKKKVLSRVTRTYVHPARGLRLVRVGEEVLRTTDEHPFWVEGKGWTRAAELVAGQRVRSDGGEPLLVVANARADAATFFAGYRAPSPVTAQMPGIQRASLDLRRVEPDELVHNIEVDGTHSYFVGSSQALVHNK